MTDWFKVITEPLPGDGIVTVAVTAVAETEAMLAIPDFLRRTPDGGFMYPDAVPPALTYTPPADYIFTDPNAEQGIARLSDRDLEMIEKLKYNAEASTRTATAERIAKLKAKKGIK